MTRDVNKHWQCDGYMTTTKHIQLDSYMDVVIDMFVIIITYNNLLSGYNFSPITSHKCFKAAYICQVLAATLFIPPSAINHYLSLTWGGGAVAAAAVSAAKLWCVSMSTRWQLLLESATLIQPDSYDCNNKKCILSLSDQCAENSNKHRHNSR